MAEPAPDHGDVATLAHQILEHLNVVKLQVSLRQQRVHLAKWTSVDRLPTQT